MRGDEGLSEEKPAHDAGMVKIPRFASELYEISDLQLPERRFFRERACARVVRYENDQKSLYERLR